MNLIKAVEHSPSELLHILRADPRVDPDTNDNYAIKMASRKGYTKVVRFLLNDSRVDPGTDENYAIRLASYYGHTKVVRLLLTDPHSADSQNKTNK